MKEFLEEGPEDNNIATFAGIDQNWFIHIGVQLTEIQYSSDTKVKARSKMEIPVTG